MNEVWAEFSRLYIKAMGEKLDKEILGSEVVVKKKTKYPKVKVTHHRRKGFFGEIYSKGGGTTVHLEIRKGVYYTGFAYCWKGDVYNKRKGKSIAFGRLMFALSILDWPDYVQTYEWMLSKIGKLDNRLYLAAFLGQKIE